MWHTCGNPGKLTWLIRVGNWRHDLKSSLRSDCKRPQGQDKDSMLIVWTMESHEWPGLGAQYLRPGRFISSTLLWETRKARPREVNLPKVTVVIRDRSGMSTLVCELLTRAGLPIAGRWQYMAYAPPPSPSPKADISKWSGHPCLLNPDLTFLNAAFQSLPAGRAAPGGKTLSLADLIQECLLWNSYREQWKWPRRAQSLIRVTWFVHPSKWEVNCVLHSLRHFVLRQWEEVTAATSALCATFSPQQFLFYIKNDNQGGEGEIPALEKRAQEHK